MTDYETFLRAKTHEGADGGFDSTFMPDKLFDFQRALVEWSLAKGRSAIFADCGLGKTAIQLTWAQNVIEKTNGRVLILAPLAISEQTVREGEKFGVECVRSREGELKGDLVITNYERLHLFDPSDFQGVVCDESSILKNMSGARRTEITAFMRKTPYRLLATATAAPNDYHELGTSSEALGYFGAMDMMAKFFRNDQDNTTIRSNYGVAPKWRFRGHAEIPFWRWVTSWARACRNPSDLGFDDGPFILPELSEAEHIVIAKTAPDNMLFSLPAYNLHQQRDERRRTLTERCEHAAGLVNGTGQPAIVWCHLNDESSTLCKMIPDAIEVCGAMTCDEKEERLMAFADGKSRVLVTKPKIGAWGLNFQHCNHVVYFPSHSFEQYYQAIRRCWRFGQDRPVTVDLVMCEGEVRVMANLRHKATQASRMFSNLVEEMNRSSAIKKSNRYTNQERVPQWLS